MHCATLWVGLSAGSSGVIVRIHKFFSEYRVVSFAAFDDAIFLYSAILLFGVREISGVTSTLNMNDNVY